MTVLKTFGKLSIVAVVTVLLLEVALRFVPQAIPPAMLVRFQDDLKASIAADAGFQLQDSTVQIPRDDGGPPLRVIKPLTNVTYPDTFAFADEPGAVLEAVMDEQGFCNPAGLYDANASFDIVAVGDSLTWCHTVAADETFTFLLGKNSPYTAYNLGLGGVGLYEYLQLLGRYGLNKRPRVVLLNIYEGNDLRDAVEYWASVKASSASAPPVQPESASPLQMIRDWVRDGPLGRSSYVVNVLLAGISYAFSYYSGENGGEAIDFSYTLNLVDGVVEFNAKNTDVDEVLYARDVGAGEIDFEVFTPGLRKFVDLSRAHDFKAVVTLIPSAHTAYRDQAIFSDADVHATLKHYSEALRSYLAAQSREQQFEFIDLTPALREAAMTGTSSELLYFPTNLHLTQHGHTVIEKKLRKRLQSKLAN